MPDWSTLEARLAWALDHIDKTREEVAEAIGTAGPRLSEWAKGRKKISGGYLQQLPEAMGVNGHWLLTGRGEPFAPAPEESRPSRAKPVIERLERADLIRRFEGALGIGSVVAMAVDDAETENLNRDELFEILYAIRDWAAEAERAYSEIYQELSRRRREADGEGGA